MHGEAKVCVQAAVYEELMGRLEEIAGACDERAEAVKGGLFGNDPEDCGGEGTQSHVMADRLERVIGCLEGTAKSLEDTGRRIRDRLGSCRL